MAHPWYHSLMSARRYGGRPEDYLEIHSWMDFSKSHVADCRHCLFLHNAWGIFLAERILGVTVVRPSDGKEMPLRPLLEDHIVQDFGKIPTLAACLDQLAPEPIERDATMYAQCEASATRWGGVWTDYQQLHSFLDWPRHYLADGRYRRILHNTWGVSMAVQAFGVTFARSSDSGRVETRAVAEGHVTLELSRLPTLEECLDSITLQRWMCTRDDGSIRREDMGADEPGGGRRMTARALTPDEIIRLGQEYEDYRRWETVRDFAERLYGPRAHHVTISVMSEYNDSSYDERVSILVTDRDGAPVPVDFSLPWWSQFAIAEERMMHYIQNASGSIEAAGELDGQGEVYAELRAFCVDELGIELSEHWRAHDPITYDYVLDAPPAISFLRVYTDETVA